MPFTWRAATGRQRLLKFHGSFVGWQDPLTKGANFDVRPDAVPSENDPNAGGVHPGATMELLDPQTSLDGTHYANSYGFAAGLATVEILRDGGIERLAHLGERLREGLSRASYDAGVAVTITGFGSGFMFSWLPKAPVTFRQAARADFKRAEAFRCLMLDMGILLPLFVITDSLLCLATPEDDIDQTVEAAAWARVRHVELAKCQSSATINSGNRAASLKACCAKRLHYVRKRKGAAGSGSRSIAGYHRPR